MDRRATPPSICSGFPRLASLITADCRRLPEAEGDVAQKQSHTVDYCDAESLRIREWVHHTVGYLDRELPRVGYRVPTIPTEKTSEVDAEPG